VSRIAYKKGPYFAEEGDFSSAGAADIGLLHQDAARGRFARHRQQRLPARDGGGFLRCRPGPSLYGFELFHNDGPWINPEDYRKLNACCASARATNADGYTMSLMG